MQLFRSNMVSTVRCKDDQPVCYSEFFFLFIQQNKIGCFILFFILKTENRLKSKFLEDQEQFPITMWKWDNEFNLKYTRSHFLQQGQILNLMKTMLTKKYTFFFMPH